MRSISWYQPARNVARKNVVETGLVVARTMWTVTTGVLVNTLNARPLQVVLYQGYNRLWKTLRNGDEMDRRLIVDRPSFCRPRRQDKVGRCSA